MGQYGPGTVKTITRGPFKFVVGADDNKRRPETIYIRQSCWVEPLMSTKAFIGSYDPDDPEDMMDLATQAGRKYDSLLMVWGNRQFVNILDKNFFDTIEEKPIVTRSFAWTRMEIGKRTFLEVEYYCVTVNSMDFRTGEPTPSRTTGKIENYTFDDFFRHIKTKTIREIIKSEPFAKQDLVTFVKSRSGK